MPKATPKFYTLRLSYKNYPHKRPNWERIASGNPSHFYVSKKNYSDHKFSLNYEEYCKLLYDFCDELFDHLLEGNTFVAPHGLGKMYFRKILNRRGGSIDYKTTAELYGEHNATCKREDRKYAYHRNNHSDKYAVRFIWKAHFNQYFASTRLWNFKMSRTANNKLANILKTDMDAIYKINE